MVSMEVNGGAASVAVLTPSQARLAEYLWRKEAGSQSQALESIPTAVPKSVFKAPIEIGGLPSPGSMHGSRIVIQAGVGASQCTAYVASGTQLYSVQLPGQSGSLKSTLRGKGGLLLPVQVEGATTTRLDHIPHRSEVQALALAEPSGSSPGLLGSIDAYGRVVVAKLPFNEAHESGYGQRAALDSRTEDGAASTSGRTNDDNLAAPFTAYPRDAGVGEGGWAGLAFVPGQTSAFATARFWAKRLDLYDRDMHVRSLPTLQNPTALQFLGASDGAEAGQSTLLAVAEGPQLSIWDLRMGERGGCTQRITVEFGGAPLYALDCTSGCGGVVGVTGASRCVYVFDTRRWTCRSRWSGCLKYEVTGMHFSSVDPALVYVNGLDYEVVCGTWDKDGSRGAVGRRFAFRGDSRWLGVHKAASSDLIGGWTDSSNLFVVDVEKGLLDPALDASQASLGQQDAFDD
ncbi:hypothetical protein KFL_002240140 [Klebsormidium nitens]|uniref:Uncharacterized protein n=1 Tax=Klebsormidium nitens TaxID=105231 RepID=A0A1Y1I5I1_KLENI|nr:hypothetical protein KFL_002240140 [Klebsormidium nitens]|eukprot:GAQ85212.1 hypothetical protein KFL_002240140 [Klebsormidium nitens]